MATGNTFGATALSSYGGFWIGTAIILTPGGFAIHDALAEESATAFADSFGIYLFGWFIFTFLLLICTLRSTVAFFTLFFTLDLAFLFLGLGYLYHDAAGAANIPLIRTGGAFGILAAFTAWFVYDLVSRLYELGLIITQVQRPCWYRRPQQLLLHHSRRTLPLVRQGP